jgi:hypothetical protein
MAEQYAPIRTEPSNQLRPIDLSRAAAKNVRDVGAIESLAFLMYALSKSFVIGNHDYESGHPETVANILDQTA